MKRKFERLLAKLKKKYYSSYVTIKYEIGQYSGDSKIEAEYQLYISTRIPEIKNFATIEELEEEVNKISEA